QLILRRVVADDDAAELDLLGAAERRDPGRLVGAVREARARDVHALRDGEAAELRGAHGAHLPAVHDGDGVAGAVLRDDDAGESAGGGHSRYDARGQRHDGAEQHQLLHWGPPDFRSEYDAVV